MILVTGGAGFIGLNFVKYLLEKKKDVFVIDKFTYASNPEALTKLSVNNAVIDIADEHSLKELDKFSFTDSGMVFLQLKAINCSSLISKSNRESGMT